MSSEGVLTSEKSSLEVQGKDHFFIELQKFPDVLELFQNHMKLLTE